MELLKLFTREDHHSAQFLENFCSYNAAFAFVSLGMTALDDWLCRHNQFFYLYRTAHECIAMLEQEDSNSLPIACVRLHFSEDTDGRRYNLPSTDEVAVILPGPGEAADYRDIILQHKAI